MAGAVQRQPYMPLVLTEAELMERHATQRILQIGLTAIAAKVVALLLVNVLADPFVLDVVEPIENILYFLQVIVLIVGLVLHRIESRVNLHANDVTQLLLRIDRPFAAIARVVKHNQRPLRQVRKRYALFR